MPRTTRTTRAAPSADTDYKEVTKKALYAGAIGTAAGYFLFGETEGSLELGGMSIPASVGIGVGTAGGSVVGDLLSGYVVEKLDQSRGIRTAESEIIKLGVSGAGTLATLNLAYGLEPSVNGFIVGAGSKFAADAVHEQMDDALLGMLF